VAIKKLIKNYMLTQEILQSEIIHTSIGELTIEQILPMMKRWWLEDMESVYSKLDIINPNEISRIHTLLIGDRDANLLGHTKMVARTMKNQHRLGQITGEIHDLAECYLPEKGMWTDYIAGQKPSSEKEIEFSRLVKLSEQLTIEEIDKSEIINGCEKKGKLGLLLKKTELDNYRRLFPKFEKQARLLESSPNYNNLPPSLISEYPKYLRYIRGVMSGNYGFTL
jgi:hypothetical protein